MASAISDESTVAVIRLKPIEATPESFQELGQVIEASPEISLFSTITHHASVTQRLGSIGGHTWYLGVAKPSILHPNETDGVDVVTSQCGHF